VRRISRSLDIESVKRLVHSFVTSRFQLGPGVCAKEGHRQVALVQNAAERLITGTQKHERGLSRLLRDDLH